MKFYHILKRALFNDGAPITGSYNGQECLFNLAMLAPLLTQNRMNAPAPVHFYFLRGGRG
jgi:hypothetical protein